jgi:hypothetical protein
MPLTLARFPLTLTLTLALTPLALTQPPTTPPLAGIAHAAISIADLNASRAFYRKLGF